jgi:hypothetical protein
MATKSDTGALSYADAARAVARAVFELDQGTERAFKVASEVASALPLDAATILEVVGGEARAFVARKVVTAQH